VNHEARCAVHPDVAAVGACTRCGQFYCAPDQRFVDAIAYCATCATRSDVDWLEQFRLKYWGKRDSWAWLMGLSAVFNAVSVVAMGVVVVFGDQVPLHGSDLASFGFVVFQQVAAAVVCAAFWKGVRLARVGLLVLPLLLCVVPILAPAGFSIFAAALPLLFAIAIYQDTRNRLFFKIEVPRERLRRLWDRYANNTLARVGFQLSLAGLLMPFLSPFGLGCSILGLRRVDPDARPPVGRKGQAIAGVVLGVLGLFVGAGWVFVYASGRHS
jgi:hypothetical protein